MMGVGEDTDEVLRVSQLMGVKTFLNEFIAYQQMGEMIKQGLLSVICRSLRHSSQVFYSYVITAG